MKIRALLAKSALAVVIIAFEFLSAPLLTELSVEQIKLGRREVDPRESGVECGGVLDLAVC